MRRTIPHKLRTWSGLNLPKKILDAQIEARKEENYGAEDLSPAWSASLDHSDRDSEIHISFRQFLFYQKAQGTVAYRLELPEQLSRVHNTSHVSNLKKCFSNEPLVIPLDEIQIDDKLNFIEEPVKIMDREVKRLKQSHIPIIKC
ncbi:hypothetical protein Tco_0183180 [Tanacetum coccineum]